MKKLKTLLLTLAFVIFATTTVSAALRLTSEEKVYLKLEQSVFYPKHSHSKLPVVFLAHNGGADKSAWGDFPQQVANAGFFTVNITYKSWDTTEVKAAIEYTLKKYANKIDTNRVSFIGGCHGGKDLLQIMSEQNSNYKIKSAVALSISEEDQGFKDALKVSHPPILAYYSTKDELGQYYQEVTKRVVEEVITEPKKVVALEETAHGNDLVTKGSSKVKVRQDIIDWIKSNNK